MVMKNRGDGSDAPHWWDDLPPKVRGRITRPLVSPEPNSEPEDQPEPPIEPAPVTRGELIADLSRLAVAFALALLGILLFLSAAVHFVYG